MEIDEHLKYTLYVMPISQHTKPKRTIPANTQSPACNSTPAPEPASLWSPAGHPTTSCNRRKLHRCQAQQSMEVELGDTKRQGRNRSFPNQGHTLISSRIMQRIERKENSFKRHPRFPIVTTARVTIEMIRLGLLIERAGRTWFVARSIMGPYLVLLYFTGSSARKGNLAIRIRDSLRLFYSSSWRSESEFVHSRPKSS